MDTKTLCDWDNCLQPATESVEDVHYCDKHYVQLGDLGAEKDEANDY